MWFEFNDEFIGRAYDDFLVQVARQELSSNIQSLWNLETTYLSGRSRLELNPEWSFGHRGEFFEHLVLDVLNESTSVAKRANLAEDILEKTDLRVTFPSLTRRRGARLKSPSPLIVRAKIVKPEIGYLPDEIILLTPVEFASTHFLLRRLFYSINFHGTFFGNALDLKTGAKHLAQELHQLFVDFFHLPRPTRWGRCGYYQNRSANSFGFSWQRAP